MVKFDEQIMVIAWRMRWQPWSRKHYRFLDSVFRTLCGQRIPLFEASQVREYTTPTCAHCIAAAGRMRKRQEATNA